MFRIDIAGNFYYTESLSNGTQRLVMATGTGSGDVLSIDVTEDSVIPPKFRTRTKEEIEADRPDFQEYMF